MSRGGYPRNGVRRVLLAAAGFYYANSGTYLDSNLK
jgi:hypothetical protein